MKILYGLPSEGMGHATRSKVIISYLLSLNHDVRIVTSDRALKFMEQSFPGKVYSIHGFHFAYEKGKVSKVRTVTNILKTAPKDLMENLQKYKFIHNEFQPDLVISDFETFTAFFAAHYKVPIISIDNIQVIDRCVLDFPIPRHEKDNFNLARNIVKFKVPNCRHYLITSFFKAEVCRKNTEIVPSILRDEIIHAKASTGDHVLVYQTSASQDDLIDILKSVAQDTFFVYGLNRSETLGNVILKPFSETGFIADLASAKAVIANGGFSLISEAVYLHKPVCSVPVKDQFEQFVNASYIDKLGYGKRLDEFSAAGIKAFLYDLALFQQNVNSYKQNGNVDTFAKITETINAVLATASRPKKMRK